MSKRLTLLGAIVAVAWLGASAPAEAAAYIKFDGIDGEARDTGHRGWFEVQETREFQELLRKLGDDACTEWISGGRGRDTVRPGGATRRGAGSRGRDTVRPGGATRRGAGSRGELVVVLKIDKSSPKLKEQLARGKVFPKVELDVQLPGSRDYQTCEFSDVRIESSGYTDAGRVTYLRVKMTAFVLYNYIK